MSKTWCPLPWIFQAIRNNGDIRVCCYANVSTSQGLLKKENGETYNAHSDDLKEARNSPTLKKIRLDMLKGKDPETCIRCQTEEENGIQSSRVFETRNWKKVFDFKKALSQTKKDGSVDPLKTPLIYYDLRFGNRCNLKCRMCGSTDSDSWYSDHVKVWGVDSFQDSHGKVKLVKKNNGVYETENRDYDWVFSPKFWKQIKENAPAVRHLFIIGGEPLLIERHYELLETIIKYGSPSEVTVEYNSNITWIPKKALKLWKHFKLVNIGASIDAYGALNDYIRYPSCFQKIEKNLEKLDKLSGNINLCVATTVQAYNIFHLTDLIQWKLKKRFLRVNREGHTNPLITAHLLHKPNYLNVKMLPKSYKIQVEEKFDHFLDSFPDWLKEQRFSNKQILKFHSVAKKMLNGYVNYMNSEDWSYLIPKFWKYTQSLDSIRKQSLKAVMPELYQSLFSDRSCRIHV